MKLFYSRSSRGNFGDDLNAWLWTQLWPNIPFSHDDGLLLIGIGTILGQPLPPGRWLKLVLGSGVGYGAAAVPDDTWRVVAVRGPLTAKILNLPDSAIATDGAALLRTLPAYARAPQKRRGVVFIPHVSAAEIGHWREVCRLAGITYVDPREDSRKILGAINDAALVLADCLHAAIAADALRVPWRPLASSRNINTFKWLDWAMGLGVAYRPVRLISSSFVESVRDRLLPWFKQDYFVAVGADTSLEQACKTLRHARTPAWRRLWLDRLWWRVIKPGLRALADSRFSGTKADLPRIRRAAEQLAVLAQEPGVLSDEARLDEGIRKLQEALAGAKRQAGAHA